MFKFFKRIRQQLLSQNRFSKYLFYAIGEIVLVVIGILIALQVNNWNLERKAIQEEIIILKNIKEDITLDTLDIFFNLSYHKKFYEAEMQLLNLLKSEKIDSNELVNIDFSDALGTLLFTELHESTFNNLQNNDIGILSNNRLRKKISRFYDYYSKAITDMSNNLDGFKIYESKLPYFKRYFKITENQKIILQMSEEDIFEHNLGKFDIQPLDLEGAINDEAFKFTLNEALFFRRAFINFHEAILEEIAKLNISIEEELNILINQD